MNKNLTVILDCSGSFDENGKIEILRALRLTIARLAKNFGMSADFFIWRDDVRPMANPKEVMPQGTAQISALEKFLADCPAGTKIILLSDGAWKIEDSAELKSVLDMNKIFLFYVAVGADANYSTNYNISTFGGVWSSADLPAAVQTLLSGGAS